MMLKKIVLLLLIFASGSQIALAKLYAEVTIPREVKPGDMVLVSIKTEADAKCIITASDAGLNQQVLKIGEETADAKGNASWTFQVPQNYSSDAMPVNVSVSKGGETENSAHSIAVKK